MRCAIIVTLACAVSALPAFPQSLSSNIITGAGYLYPSPITVAPGQVITLFVTGIGQGEISVTVQQGKDYPAPVLNVGTPIINCPANPQNCTYSGPVTIQIPYELQPPCSGPVCTALAVATTVFVTQNGTAGPTFQLNPLGDRIHILSTCDTVVPNGSGMAPPNGLPCAPFVTHADGSLVTSQSPAQANEELVAYAVGLGATNPAVATGQAPTTPVPTQEVLMLAFDYLPNALPAQPIPSPSLVVSRYQIPLFSGLVAGYVGLYQINFLMPPPPAGIYTCGGPVVSNVTVNVGGTWSFDGAGICVAAGDTSGQ